MTIKQPSPIESMDSDIFNRPRELEARLVDTLEHCMVSRNHLKPYRNDQWPESS
jgi:hypothetical protein